MHSTIGFFPPDDICEHESDDTSNLDPYVDAWEHAIAWEYHPGFSDSVDKAISLAPTLNFPAVLREQCLKMDEQAIHVPMPMLRAETSVGDPPLGVLFPFPDGNRQHLHWRLSLDNSLRPRICRQLPRKYRVPIATLRSESRSSCPLACGRHGRNKTHRLTEFDRRHAQSASLGFRVDRRIVHPRVIEAQTFPLPHRPRSYWLHPRSMDGSTREVPDEWDTFDDELAHQTGQIWVEYIWLADEDADSLSKRPHVPRPKE